MLRHSLAHSPTDQRIVRFRNSMSSVGATLALLASPGGLVSITGT
jgi:hypothetical protein